jgi:hypothetical protein
LRGRGKGMHSSYYCVWEKGRGGGLRERRGKEGEGGGGGGGGEEGRANKNKYNMSKEQETLQRIVG